MLLIDPPCYNVSIYNYMYGMSHKSHGYIAFGNVHLN